MKEAIKLAGYSVLRAAGLFHIVRESRWREKRLLILGYHGFSIEDEHLWNPELFLPASDFDTRLRRLKDGGYSVLPLAEGLDRLYHGRLPKKSVVITVDDGNYDFYKQALPLLKQYGFPVTVYLTTFYCDYNKPVFGHVCSYMLWKRQGEVIRARDLIGSPLELDLRSAGSRAQSLDCLLSFAEEQHLSAEEKNQLAERLAGLLSIDYAELLRKRLFHRMNPSEVAAIAAAGVDVQLHTHRHRTPADRALFHREIDDNRCRIEAMTGRPTGHFSYPNSVCKPDFLTWLSQKGIVSAMTCSPGLARAAMDPLRLPRVGDGSNMSLIEFDGWVSGIASFVPHRRMRDGPNHA